MTMIRGSCLCGDVAWESPGPFAFMSHCHCTRCRKSHGAAFATFCMTPAEGFRVTRGQDGVVPYQSSPGTLRPFCRRCGSVVPDPANQWNDHVFLPAGPLDDDPGVRPAAHIFVASKAPWFDIADEVPRFDAFPPGAEDAPVLPDGEPPIAATGKPRGSCLCGGVAFVVEGEPVRAAHCHCTRCRKARGAAHASNLFTTADGVRLVRGEDLLASYKVPEAKYFSQVFCRTCGSPMPRFDRDRNLAVIPLGALDDAPPMRPQYHIYVGSKAPWYELPADGLPRHEEGPPAR